MAVPSYQTGNPHGTPQGPRPRYTAQDHEVIRSRNIPRSLAEAAGLRSITADEAGAYGHRALSGLLIPSWNTQGEIDRYQLRPHEAPIDPDTGKPRKYLWPAGARQSLYVPPSCLDALRDVTAPLIITEAPLKALAIVAAMEAEGIAGVAVVAVAGVYGWRSQGMPLSDHGDIPMNRKEGERIRYRRRVLLAFDSDALTNPHVSRARWEYASYLRRRGARVQIIDVPAAPGGGKQGIDDALAAGLTLRAMVKTATPAPDIMPALDTDTAIDGEASELERLRTENAALRAHVSTLTQVITTPHVPARTKALILRSHTLAKAKAARGEVDDAGAARISTAEISNDWRPATPRGETTPATNTDGSVPLMKRGAVLKAAREARALGLIDFTERKVRRESENGRTYQDTEIVIKPPASIVAGLRPVATYTPAALAPRPYRKQEPCPHCGEVHERTVIRQTFCGSDDDPGCGGLISEPAPMVLKVPPASDPDATPEQRAKLERVTAARESSSTKNVEEKDADISGPSPAPVNELSPRNVEEDSGKADRTSRKNVEVTRPGVFAWTDRSRPPYQSKPAGVCIEDGCTDQLAPGSHYYCERHGGRAEAAS